MASFNWQMSDIKKDVIEYMIHFHYSGKVAKSEYLWELIYNDAMQFLGLPIELNLSDEILLEELIERNQRDQESLKAMIGEEKYNDLINRYKGGRK